jgi:hypothetical protein
MIEISDAQTAQLRELQRIPSQGGHKIGEFLYRLGREHRGLGDVVEVGSWLGSSCAHLALGLAHAGSQAWIHCYDRFRASKVECGKALKWNVELVPRQDTEPIFRRNVESIYPRIRAHKTDLREIVWDGGPIETYVDDAAKQRHLFLHVMQTFGPAFVPGATTVVLMDFNMYRHAKYTEKKRQQYRTQPRAMSMLRRNFRLVYLDWPRSSMACFRYERPLDFASFDRILGPDPLKRRVRAACHRWLYRLTHW